MEFHVVFAPQGGEQCLHGGKAGQPEAEQHGPEHADREQQDHAADADKQDHPGGDAAARCGQKQFSGPAQQGRNGSIRRGFQRQGGMGVPVDAPALVGIFAVGAVLKDAVDGIAGGKHGLAAGLHICAGMGVEAGVPVLIVAVEGQIAPGADLFRPGQPRPDDMAAAGKALGRVGDGLLAEWDMKVDLPLDHIDQRRGHGVLELDHAVLTGMVDLQCHPVAGVIFIGVDEGHFGVGIAGHEGVADFVQNFQFDGFHGSSP